MSDQSSGKPGAGIPRSAVMVGAMVFTVVLGLQVTGSITGKSTTGRAVGMGNQSGGCNAEVISEQVPLPESAGVVLNDIPEKIARRDAPEEADDMALEGEFIVKVSPALGGKLAGVTTGFTGVPVVDLTLDELGADGFSNVYLDGVAKRVGGGMLGGDRVFRFSSDESVETVVDFLEGLDEVDWVEPVQRISKLVTPDDAFFSYQWHMTTLGATSAWDVTMGEGVVVAVIDTGVSAGSDGFLDLLPGWDFYANDDDASDEDGHGTHVAGTIAQSTGNAVGTVGLAPQVSILPIRVLGPDGGSSTDVAAGIVWAVDQGAHVINMSLGGGGYSMAMADACEYAVNNGVTVIAATGNDGYTDHISYPAAYDSVIAVGATTMDGSIAYYSNYGPGIDITAPGGDVTADLDGDGFGDGVLQETIDPATGAFGFFFFQGTSMATPHVAGAAALLYANGVKDVADMKTALTSTADDMGTLGYDESYGHGILNPVAALAWAPPEPPPEPPPLKLKRLKTIQKSNRRGVIKWKTNSPAATYAEGTNGFSYASTELVTSHKVVFKGKKNQPADVTVRSVRDDGVEVSDTVSWPFEE
jgi:subtilisin family serine protease